jgi:putative two-component system response regulator
MKKFEDETEYILAVDDMPANLRILVKTLQVKGYVVKTAEDGRRALEMARAEIPALVLLDINMPELNGYEVCAELKKDPKLADVPVIFISGNDQMDEKIKGFEVGGVDYITKPFQSAEVNARVDAHMLNRRLQLELDQHVRHLKVLVTAQVKEIADSQAATIVALAKLSEYRDEDTGNHILRVQYYCRALAEQLAADRIFGNLVDDQFIENIFRASPLHDIGKVGIPDSILLKPGRLTPEEFVIMKTHTVIGADTLAAVDKRYPGNSFVRMGMEISRSHHEFWDGGGYPDNLSGDTIPLSARILTLADQFDALRNKRPYKAAFDAAKTYQIITEGDDRSSPAHLDPRVLASFKKITREFNKIFESLNEN